MEEFANSIDDWPWWMWLVVGATCFPLGIVLLLIKESFKSDYRKRMG